MEEKILFKTEKPSFGKICARALFLAAIVSLIAFTTLYLCWWEFEPALRISLCCVLGLFLLFLVIGAILRKSELTITDKRVFCKEAFGKLVDLPLYSISAVGTGKIFKRFSVSSASGHITVLGIKNFEEAYKTLSKLLIERQNNAK